MQYLKPYSNESGADSHLTVKQLADILNKNEKEFHEEDNDCYAEEIEDLKKSHKEEIEELQKKHEEEIEKLEKKIEKLKKNSP